MTLTERIQQTKTPREAILLLAEAIDELAAKAATPADPWEQPLKWEREAVADIEDELDRETKLALLKDELRLETDPDEAKALRASIWLLENPGEIQGVERYDGVRTQIEGGDVVLPPASPERQAAREVFAETIKLWEFLPTLTDDEAVDAFMKGGARWLYYGNRDAVMAMPIDARQFLVNDIMVDSPAEAHEVGRDILKAQDGVSQKNAVDAIKRMGGLD